MRCRTARAWTLIFGAAIVLWPSLAAAQGWELVEPMPTPRSYHAAGTVGDRWYVAGGAMADASGNEQFPSEVDVYDPSSGHWNVLGQLGQGRQYVVAASDPSQRRVLFSGGFLPAGPDGYLALATCDLATVDAVSSAPDHVGARHLHAIALAAGQFVVSGGWGMESTYSKLLDDSEMWDGVAGVWMSAGTMPAGQRAGHSMTTLRDAKDVLVVGGCRPDRAMTEVDLFDAANRSWTPAVPSHVPRCRHTAVLLNDGRVLVAGGDSYSPIRGESTAEIFDPATGRWVSAAPLNDGRFDHATVLLPDGRVLVAGGSNNPADGEYGALNSVEVYDPLADAWTSLPPMQDRRRWPTLAVLSDGVYVAGGSYSSSTMPGSTAVLASVERLSWSVLGISRPIDADAGTTDGGATDSIGSNDGGIDTPGPDGAADALLPKDGPAGSNDAPPDLTTRDADSSTGMSTSAAGGCSCMLCVTRKESVVQIAFAGVALCTALRRRRRRRRKSATACRLVALLAAIPAIGGCGRGAARGDGAVVSSGRDASGLESSAPACEQDDAHPATTDAAQTVRSILVGGGAFNEPKNAGYVGSIVPTWTAECFVVSSSGHLRASVTTTFAGTAPSADEYRDALFWSVVGFYPPLDPMLTGEEGKTLSEIVGVVSSSSSPDSSVFSLDGSFDPTIQGGAGSGPLTQIEIGLTWVRVYRIGGAFQYQVLPGDARSGGVALTLDQPATGVGGPFFYYTPLANDPSLGSEFDYTSWIGAHVVW